MLAEVVAGTGHVDCNGRVVVILPVVAYDTQGIIYEDEEAKWSPLHPLLDATGQGLRDGGGRAITNHLTAFTQKTCQPRHEARSHPKLRCFLSYIRMAVKIETLSESHKS